MNMKRCLVNWQKINMLNDKTCEYNEEKGKQL